jgi:hypothetical protein
MERSHKLDTSARGSHAMYTLQHVAPTADVEDVEYWPAPVLCGFGLVSEWFFQCLNSCVRWSPLCCCGVAREDVLLCCTFAGYPFLVSPPDFRGALYVVTHCNILQ